MAFSACHNCEERHTKCHSTCERYLEEKRRNNELKEQISKKRKAQFNADSFRKDALEKIRKRKRR